MPNHDTDFFVEAALPEDAALLARMHAESFKEAYLGEDEERNAKVLAEAAQFVTPERIEMRMALLQSSLTHSDEEFYHVVMDENAIPAGLIYGYKTDEVQELSALYVATSYFGTGVAKALTEAFVAWCDRDRPIELGVVEDNVRAQRFYQKMGFQAVSDPHESFYEYLKEIKMVKPPEGDK